MANSPLQVAADRHVLAMADVVLASVGAARDVLDAELDALESALARRDADGAYFVCERAVDAATRVLTGEKATKAAGDDEPLRGIAAVISATVEAGGSAVELCVLPTRPPGGGD